MNEQNNGIREGVEVDLQKLVLSYLRRWWVIAICGFLAALCAYYVTANHITPTYQTGIMLYVNNTKGNEEAAATEAENRLSSSNLSASKYLVNTYVNIISSNRVLEKVVEEGGLPYSAAQIRRYMTAEQVDETVIFRVNITHTDPQMAAEIANIIADVAPAEIEEIVEGSSAKIIDRAKVPTGRFSPNTRKNTMVGAAIGVVVAMVYLTLMYLLDVRIKDSEDVEMLFTLPILGQIPVFASGDSHKKGYGYSRKGYGGKGYGYQKSKTEAGEGI